VPTEGGEGILDAIQSIIQGLDTSRQLRVREGLLSKKRGQLQTPEPVQRFLEHAMRNSSSLDRATTAAEESRTRQRLTLESLGSLKSIAVFASTAAATEVGVTAISADLTRSCMDTLLPLQSKDILALSASLGLLPPSTTDAVSLSREMNLELSGGDADVVDTGSAGEGDPTEEDFFAGLF
jgi:hypothetical protein